MHFVLDTGIYAIHRCQKGILFFGCCDERTNRGSRQSVTSKRNKIDAHVELLLTVATTANTITTLIDAGRHETTDGMDQIIDCTVAPGIGLLHGGFP